MPKKYPTDQRDRACGWPWSDCPSTRRRGPQPRLLGRSSRGRGPETPRKWIVQAQVDGGDRLGRSSDELGEIKALKSQVRDLTEANEILQAASIFFAGNSTPEVADLRVRR